VSGPETSSVIGDVIHDVVLADGEVVEVFGANAYVQEGPLTTVPTLRALPVDGAERAFGISAG
jgi:hypothetical protein